jgi:signal transduction histidine kinase
LKCSIDDKGYERSLFDWNQVQVVIHNLLDNAIKYSHRNRIVSISCRFDEHKKLYILKFDSYGVGIAKEEQENIFLKFRRGKIMKDPRRFIPGTGIGLTVSRKIARDHEGDVVLRECRQGEGVEGKGFIEEGWRVVFEFTLPLKNS